MLAAELRPAILRTQVPGETEPQETDAAVLLPHEVFGALYGTSQAQG